MCTSVQYSHRCLSLTSSAYISQITMAAPVTAPSSLVLPTQGDTARHAQGLHRTSIPTDQARPSTDTGNPRKWE